MLNIEEHFPDFFRSADQHSDRWQKRYLWSEKLQLVALLGAAGASAVSGSAVVVVLLFAGAICSQMYRLLTRADEKWWNGRAGAESAKTASWLYVVGGAPFSMNNPSADREFARRLVDVAREIAELVPVPTAESHVTTEMRQMRTKSLSERVRAYQTQRIQGQCSWYSAKSRFNEARATRWSLIAVLAQALGLFLGIMAALDDWSLDAVGLFSALAAAVVAWMAVKQYEVLARSYAVASAELGAIDVQISTTEWHEDEWANFVNTAEDAISREHTSWRASRAV